MNALIRSLGKTGEGPWVMLWLLNDMSCLVSGPESYLGVPSCWTARGLDEPLFRLTVEGWRTVELEG